MKNLLKLSSIILLSLFMYSCDDDPSDDNGGSSNNLKRGQIEMKGHPSSSSQRMSFYATADKITIDWGDGFVDELTPNGIEKTFSHEYATPNLYTITINTEKLTKYSLGTGTYSELRFGDCPDLKRFFCNGKGLTVLNIKKAASLIILSCSNNKLTSLDVSRCTALKALDCGKNQLTSLDVSKRADLEILYCNSNQLTSLDVSKCTTLIELECNKNQLSADAINKLFHSLHDGDIDGDAIRELFHSLYDDAINDDYHEVVGYDYHKAIGILGNPGTNGCDRSIAINRGWKVY